MITRTPSVSVVTVAGKNLSWRDLDNAEAEDKLGQLSAKVDMMKWNHHYDATISNTINFLENLSPKNDYSDNWWRY